MSDPVRAAYAAGLAMLARRELSEARLRERLRRKDHAAEAIDAAVARLRGTGAR
jgi:SOS response regulatory protein OraA/RecX